MTQIEIPDYIEHENIIEKWIRRFRNRKLVKYIQTQSSDLILEIGCGHYYHFIRSIAPKVRLAVAYDASVLPGTFLNGKLVLKRANLSGSIPEEAESYDIVVMLAILEHLENPQKILKEIYRILKPNGRLILTVPSHFGKVVLELLAYRLRLIHTGSIDDHKRHYWKKDIIELLVSAGFKENNTKHCYFQLWCNNFLVARK